MVNQQVKPYNVTLIGDDCLDIYQYGTADRLSPEAPIPVFCPVRSDEKAGMAANVASNLQNLGINVKYHHTSTSIKTRLIDQRSKQHLLRMDVDAKCQPLKFGDINFAECDAVVISDYCKGTVTYDLIDEIQNKVSLPIFIDTKKTNLKFFDRCIVKINETEWNARSSDGNNVVVTCGGSHVSWGSKKFSVPSVNVFDVCGAGDTFLAGLVYEYLNTRSMDSAIQFAIRAAGITVQHLGVYAPTLEEIKKCD